MKNLAPIPAVIPKGSLDSTSTSTVMTATVPGIDALFDGVCVWLTNGVVTSASGFTININGLGRKPVYQSQEAATRSTTIFNINYTALLIYNEGRVSGGCWDYVYGYDSNTNTIGYQIRTNSSSLPMTSVVYRYRLLFTSADNAHFVPANNSTSTKSTTAKTVCQDKIDPFGRIVYYGSTTSVAAGSRPSTSYLWQQYAFTIGYSFVVTLTEWKPVYLKCAPQTDGSAIIDSTTPFVQTLPSTEDGKIYIFLGVAYSSTEMELTLEHPVYWYKDGMIRPYTNAPAGGAVSSVNGQTGAVSLGAADVGALPDTYTAPVTSVNTKTGAVSLSASDVGALPDDITYVSSFNGSTGAVTYTAPVTSVNGNTGAVTVAVPSASSATPQALGTAAAGSSTDYSRADHVHAKPTYSKSDVGLGNVDNVQQYSASNPPPYPVTSVNGSTGAVTVSVPTKTSDLTNDSGFITGMYIASYGSSTYAQVLAAYQANKVVYCRASSNTNPATGDQKRLAFLAYVSDPTTPTEFEFQYYRSVSTHSDSQQGDQVFIYKLNSSTGWSVTTREAYTKISPSTGLSKSYSNGTLTVSVANPLPSVSASDNGKVLTVVNGAWTEADNVSVPSASSATPEDLGTAAAGTSTDYSRADHVHAKPTYSKSDVGLGNVDNVKQYSASNPPPYPVTSVNGSTGDVSVSVPSASSATPKALGTAAAGTSSDYSRADHVHAKPTYSKSDVGLGNVDNVKQYSASNPPPYPVTSVNGNTGAVSLSIPSKTSDLSNDSGYVTEDDIVASTSISNTGLVSFKNSSGTALFTLQLPLYNGGAN